MVGFLVKMDKRTVVDGKLKCACCKKRFDVSFFFKKKNSFKSYCKSCFIFKSIKIRTNPIDIVNLENEEWKDILGFENRYQISNLGRIKSLDKIIIFHEGTRHISRRGKVLKHKINKFGYHSIGLYKKEEKKTSFFNIHRLVAIAFIPNPENKPEVNHKNGIKSDNRVDNLEWNTRAENNRHAIDTGLLVFNKGSEVYNAKLNEHQVALIRRYYRRFPETTQRWFAKKIDLDYRQLNQVLKGKIWKHVVI